ncbi:MAG: acyltransferase family protein, partial [Sedimentitalea sp.]
MQYRREIDGLRAVAVVPVILFHAGFQIFSGGFVGVDVFFVISGYLITTILITELARGDFSIVRFYERRARRILPALVVVVLACIPFAWLWMLPSQFEDFGQSVAAVGVFLSNVLFWAEDGYFSAESELKPLLHTWSLAVEEQYYLIFPLFLAAIWRLGRAWVIAVTLILALASLGFSEWAWRNQPSMNFYLAPSRAWELLAGSLAAMVCARAMPRPNQALSALGLLMIVGSILFLDDTVPFPSVYALLPVVGAVLLILFCDSQTLAGRLLSTRGFVGVGLISYSAYLWHQPLFAFARIRSVGHPSDLLMLGLAIGALGLAWLSWRFVEQPFRKRPTPALASRFRLFFATGLVTIAMIGFGVVVHRANGFDQRVEFAAIEKRLSINPGLDSSCSGQFTLAESCATGPSPSIVVWGDSFAMHLGQAFSANSALPFRQHTITVCAPILDISLIKKDYPESWAQTCMVFNDQVFDWLGGADEVEIVVLSSLFGILGNDILQRDETVRAAGDQMEFVTQALKSTVERLRAIGKRVIIVSPTPQTGENIGRCLASAQKFGVQNSVCDFEKSSLSAESRATFQLMERISSFVPVMRLDDMICKEG